MEGGQNNGLIRNINTPSTLSIFSSDGDIYSEYDNYNEYSLKGIQESSPMSVIFFSDSNVEALQKTIRFEIYKIKQRIISEQSPNELYTVMRSVYLQNANSRSSTNKFMKNLQILNKMVVDYCVQNVSDQLEQYTNYMLKISNLPSLMERPEYSPNKNTTVDSSNLLGGN
tara:strand:+ start:761 stop:1270 length:510 start_codon:yes stop_codon:yes gene_type:complete